MIVLNLLLFGDVLFWGEARVLSSQKTDLFLHFTAWRQFAFEQLRQGHLVLWNPHYLCGAPFFGGFEAALLYPPNWFYMIFPLAFAINFGIVLHVFLAGLFVYFWAIYRGLHPLACFVAGVVFMFGGSYFLHVFAGHLPNLCTMVWAPLLFLALDGWLEETSLAWILLGVFAVSMQLLAGHPQYVYFTAIIACFYTILNLAERDAKLKRLSGLFFIYGGASLLTAVQLWTGLEALTECGRNIPMEFRSVGSFSLPPENLLTLLLPDFFGDLSAYWGRWYLWEVSLFTGISAFLLIAVAVGPGGSPRQRRWALTTVFISFVFAFGSYTPLLRFLYEYIPGFQGLRGICKFDFLACLFLSLLTGIGLDRLIKNKKILQWPSFFAAIAGVLLMAVGGLIFLSYQKGLQGGWAQWFLSLHWLKQTVLTMELSQREKYVRGAGLQAAFSLWMGGGTFMLLFLLLRFQPFPRSKVYGIAALSVLELFIFARSNRPTFDLPLLENKFNQFKSVYVKDPGDYRVYGTANGSLVTGGYDIWEDEPMVLSRYGRFVCYSQGLPENQLFSVVPIFKKFSKVFGMIRLKYLIEDREPPQAELMPFKRLGRMQLVDHWEVVPDGQKLLKSLFDPGFNPAQNVFLEEPPGLTQATGKNIGSVEWKDLSTEAIEIQADVLQPSILLITDNYSKGWRATSLPGSSHDQYQVMPGNYFLRAIPLSSGHHHILLQYRPQLFEIGKWISIFSCAIYVGILIFLFKRRFYFK
ncbi:MAG TPA: hypothetical protein VIJ93_08505 [bacterium]